jgi:hypothetical protein
VDLGIYNTMEPNWNKVKSILKKYEDFIDCIRNQFGETMSRLSNMENLGSILLNKTYILSKVMNKTWF